MPTIQLSLKIAFSLLLCWQPSLFAADYAREQRWATEIEPALLVGDVTYLEAQQHKFLSILTPAPNAKGAAIVVHGLGVHPDWGVIHNLRTGLAESGYTTLALQMPILAATAEAHAYETVLPEAAARLDRATRFLLDQGYQKIAIVSHSMGSRMSNYYLVGGTHPAISAWVSIGITGAFRDPAKLKLPILDIYGEDDFKQVLAGAAARARVLKHLPGAKQLSVTGADHFFETQVDELLKQTSIFLDAHLQ
jgi:pimeloyl-ACP methyl ester carboxylesterase